MRVSLEIPEPKTAGLDTALARQFADIQRQLLSLVKEQASSKHQMHQMMLEGMAEQREDLVNALSKLMGMVGQSMKGHGVSEALTSALQGLKSTLAQLPDSLKGALDTQYAKVQAQESKVSVAPRVTVQMPSGLMTRLDALESALVTGLKRSRSRTFGSNY